jgi:hypothetical protein
MIYEMKSKYIFRDKGNNNTEYFVLQHIRYLNNRFKRKCVRRCEHGMHGLNENTNLCVIHQIESPAVRYTRRDSNLPIWRAND